MTMSCGSVRGLQTASLRIESAPKGWEPKVRLAVGKKTVR